MPSGPMSRQVPDGLAGAVVEVAAGVAEFVPALTVAEIPDPVTETLAPAETPATEAPAPTDVPFDPDATVAPAEPWLDETFAPVEPEPAETVTLVDDPGLAETLTVVDPPEPAEPEPDGDELALGVPPDAAAALLTGGFTEDLPAARPEVRAMPPERAGDTTPVRGKPGPSWPASGTWPGWAPPTAGGEPGALGACSMCTDTEVSRKRTISEASPNMGTMLPAGCSRTIAARFLADISTRSAALAATSGTDGSGGFCPRRAACRSRRMTALRCSAVSPGTR